MIVLFVKIPGGSSSYQGLSADSVQQLHVVAMFHDCLTLLVSSQSVENMNGSFLQYAPSMLYCPCVSKIALATLTLASDLQC